MASKAPWPRVIFIGALLLWSALAAGRLAAQTPVPATRPLAGFEEGGIAPFTASGADVASAVPDHATKGWSALRLTGGMWPGKRRRTGRGTTS